MQIPLPPKSAPDAADYIWREQDVLNARCHPTGRGTIDKDGTRTPAEKEQLEFDYYLALHDEVTELIANFVWKHWAKEAREGRRFQLINPKAEAGEGTAQNVPVELIDIVFFTVSLLHVRGARLAWQTVWGTEENWAEAVKAVDHEVPELTGVTGLARLQNNANNAFLLRTLQQFEIALFANDNEVALVSLLEAFAASGITWNQALELYFQKLRVNHERQDRGRKQVGDAHAHKENEGIKAS